MANQKPEARRPSPNQSPRARSTLPPALGTRVSGDQREHSIWDIDKSDSASHPAPGQVSAPVPCDPALPPGPQRRCSPQSIRLNLEAEIKQNLKESKPIIDEEILLVLGQMDLTAMIFCFLYLGSEWNASNLEELTANGVTHFLNVTREIDNFFSAVFKYLNIREWDVEETDLLQSASRKKKSFREKVPYQQQRINRNFLGKLQSPT